MKVRMTRVDKELPLPAYHTPGAVAFDLYPRISAVIPPRETALLPANFIIEVPEGYALILANRSGTGKKKGLTMANGIGVVDQDYHGPQDEIHLLVRNFTDQPVTVERGERIAQGFIVPVERAEFEELAEMKKDSRGGFGSTG